MDKSLNIFLIGFSGSGKSTVGPILARLAKACFIDSDDLIEECFGKPIGRIFAEDGERVFRRAEMDVINEVISSKSGRRVIALGGGAFELKENWQKVKEHGIVVYLSCSVRELYKRLKNDSDRPLLRVRLQPGESKRQAKQRQITALLNKRKKHYSLADIKISTTEKSPSEVSRHILKKTKDLNA